MELLVFIRNLIPNLFFPSHSLALDDCERCKNVKTEQTCDVNTMVVKPMSLQAAPAELFSVCSGKDLSGVECELVNAAG